MTRMFQEILKGIINKYKNLKCHKNINRIITKLSDAFSKW